MSDEWMNVSPEACILHSENNMSQFRLYSNGKRWTTVEVIPLHVFTTCTDFFKCLTGALTKSFQNHPNTDAFEGPGVIQYTLLCKRQRRKGSQQHGS